MSLGRNFISSLLDKALLTRCEYSVKILTVSLVSMPPSGITLKDFVDFQKNDVIEVYNSTITERTIQ